MAKIIPPITVIEDPADHRLLIYDGNKRTRHAAEHNYALKAIILSSQEDLTSYFATNTPFGLELKNLMSFLSL